MFEVNGSAYEYEYITVVCQVYDKSSSQDHSHSHWRVACGTPSKKWSTTYTTTSVWCLKLVFRPARLAGPKKTTHTAAIVSGLALLLGTVGRVKQASLAMDVFPKGFVPRGSCSSYSYDY